jgi:ribosome-associated protein
MSTDHLPPERPSKSQRKREMISLQEIGETLVALPGAALAKIPLEGLLLEAITVARSLKAHEAKRRQMQYIGRLMRDVDPEPIKTALEKITHQHHQNKAQFHQIERWRDQLIQEGDPVIQQFLDQYPETDRQHLRQLVRRAQQEKEKNKNQGAMTELFRYLRETVESQ